MPKILIPPKASPPRECPDHKAPILKGSYYEFELSNEEHKFWKDMPSAQREKMRDEASTRCFYEVLHEAMKNHPKRASIFSTAVSAVTSDPSVHN